MKDLRILHLIVIFENIFVRKTKFKSVETKLKINQKQIKGNFDQWIKIAKKKDKGPKLLN